MLIILIMKINNTTKAKVSLRTPRKPVSKNMKRASALKMKATTKMKKRTPNCTSEVSRGEEKTRT